MAIVTEISWEQVADPAFTPLTRQAFRTAVTTVAARAKAAMDASHSRIDKAVAIVLAGDVELLADGTARVASQCEGATQYRVVNGTCDCKDFPQAPEGWCKHRLSAAIARRAMAQAVQVVQTPVAPARQVTIPREFITTIHGKEFVQFAGLLAMAHAQGLTSLTAELVSVTHDLALARARATFADGRTFTEAADATPDNVNAGVRKHFARCALTRAKARALRDALNISTCAVEELD